MMLAICRQVDPELFFPSASNDATDGDQFGRVLNSLFTALEHAIDEDDQ